MSGSGPRVLVADGAPHRRTEMREALRSAGYRAFEAPGEAEALALIGDPAGLALVVTDIDMPGFDNMDVAAGARERDPLVPILFVTERTDAVTDRLTPPPCYCLSKPFTAAVLLEVAARLLAPCPTNRSASETID